MAHVSLIYLLKIVIVHSYVRFAEGSSGTQWRRYSLKLGSGDLISCVTADRQVSRLSGVNVPTIVGSELDDMEQRLSPDKRTIDDEQVEFSLFSSHLQHFRCFHIMRKLLGYNPPAV